MYRKPYPEAYDQIALPSQYRVLDFIMFSGQENKTTVEHISWFLIQCGDASAVDALRIRLFPLSLSGSTFAWFTSLPPNSIITWVDLDKPFYKYFFARVHEIKITDLTAIKQRNDEPVTNYIQRFRDIRSRCFSLSLSDSQLAELAFQGLLPHIKEQFFSHEFVCLSHLAQRLACVDVQAPVQTRKESTSQGIPPTSKMKQRLAC